MRNLLIFTLVLSVPLSAQSIAHVDTLQATTVTAIRGTVTTPITQTTLSKTTLTQKNFGQEMPFLLSTTPNVTVASDNGAFSGYTYMRLRGLDQTRINMTLDGVPLNEPEDQGAYFSNFVDFTNSVQSAQIQRGVGTSSNGTAAYAGSVNFQSINPLLSSTGIETNVKQNVAADATIKDATNGVFGRFTKQTTDGYRDHSGNQSSAAYVSALHVGNASTLKLTAFSGISNNEMAYLASSVEAIRKNRRDNPLSPDETDHFRENFVSATVTRALPANLTVSATGYHIDLTGGYGVKLDTMYRFDLASNWEGALATLNYNGERARIDLGLHGNVYTRSHAETVEQYKNHGDKNERSGFAKIDYAIGTAVNLMGDVQGRTVDFTYHPDVRAGIAPMHHQWTFVNPKVGVTIRPSARTKVYASAGRNTREPTRNDMFAGFDNIDTTNVAFVGTLDRMKPETVNDVEVGTEYHAPTFAITANVFDMEFRNEIAAIGKLSYIGLPLRKNVDASYRRGVEVDAVKTLSRRLTVATNGSLMKARIAKYTDDNTGLIYTHVRPLLTPSVVSNTTVTYTPMPRLTLGLVGRYVGKSQLDNTDSHFVNPSSFLTDANVSLVVGHITTRVWVSNLANRLAFTGGYTDGSDAYYFVASGRRANITLRYNF